MVVYIAVLIVLIAVLIVLIAVLLVVIAVLLVGRLLLCAFMCMIYNRHDESGPIGFGIIVSFTVFSLLALYECSKDGEEIQEKKERKIEIYSLGLNKGVINNQSFFLGNNGVEYLYFVGDSIKGFKMESVPARKTIIKYLQPEEKPYVLFNDVITKCLGDTIREVVSVELYIPHGSIVQEYKIDL